MAAGPKTVSAACSGPVRAAGGGGPFGGVGAVSIWCPACGSPPDGGACAGSWQWPIAACSGVQVDAGCGGCCAGGSVQCPIAACSGVQAGFGSCAGGVGGA